MLSFFFQDGPTIVQSSQGSWYKFLLTVSLARVTCKSHYKVCIGVSHPPFPCQAPLKSANCPGPLSFGTPPPLKIRFFSETPEY